MQKKILKNIINQQEFTLGIILQVLDPDITEAVALSGLDFICFDLEHTGKTIESAYPCIMAAYAHNVPTLIRTTDKDQQLIEQALDSGAQGVLVPTVETVEECKNIVKAAKFAPMGERGYCPMDATMRWLNDSPSDMIDYANEMNKNTFVAVLIETPVGFKNLPEMLKVEGIDAFHLGFADYGMRVGKDMFDPDVQKVVNDAAEMINKSDKLSIPLVLPSLFKAQYEKGAKMGIVAKSIGMIIKESLGGIKKELSEIIEETKK